MTEISADKQMKERIQQLKQYGMIIALVVIYGVFAFMTDFKNTAPMNINNLIMQNSYVIILAIGMLLCCLTGNVDLSVGSVVAFTGALAAIMILDYSVPIPIAVIATLFIGVIIGIWQGFFISYLGISPFIVSLANMLVFRGLTMVILNGQTKGPLPPEFTQIGAGFLPQVFVNIGGTKLELIALLVGIIVSIAIIMMEINSRHKKAKAGFKIPSIGVSIIKLIVIICIINFFTIKLALYMGLPVVLLIMLALILIYGFITSRTVPGRQIYAVGGNKKAAALSGIKTDRVMFWIYTNMGLLSALAGVVLAARNASATPKAGDMFEMDAIAMAVFGGISSTGGKGNLAGGLISAFIIVCLRVGLGQRNVHAQVILLIIGVLLICAVALPNIIENIKRAVKK